MFLSFNTEEVSEKRSRISTVEYVVILGYLSSIYKTQDFRE
jgi:hypothetical protein